MRHVTEAVFYFLQERAELSPFIKLENAEDVPGVAPVLSFTIQSDPISQVGVNGVQAVDILRVTALLFESLNNKFHCRKNMETMIHIQKAIHFQEVRTRDRIKRNVEGINAV